MTMTTQVKSKPRSTPRVKPPKRARLFDLSLAETCAAEVIDALSPGCALIATAGSIRRRVARVHDIDIVLYPIIEHVGQLNLFDPAAVMTSYPHVLFDILRLHDWGGYGFGKYPRAIHFEYRSIPVDLFLAEPDGQNYYALLALRTGSAKYNLSLAQQARRLGLNFRAGHGVFKGDQRVDDGTEAGIWRALQLEYIEPAQRE